LSKSEEESSDEDASYESSKEINESDEVSVEEESSDNDTDEGRTDSVNMWTLVKDLASDKPPVINDFTSPCGPVWMPLQAEPVEYFDRFFAAMGNRLASVTQTVFRSPEAKHSLRTRERILFQ
jgi:hypothetical protein